MLNHTERSEEALELHPIVSRLDLHPLSQVQGQAHDIQSPRKRALGVEMTVTQVSTHVRLPVLVERASRKVGRSEGLRHGRREVQRSERGRIRAGRAVDHRDSIGSGGSRDSS
jgi:hypothetical protein